MSMRTYVIEGFGISEDVFEQTSIHKQMKFIEKYLPMEYKQIKAELPSENDATYSAKCEDVIDGFIGFGSLFATAMTNNESGLDITYIRGEDQSAILYEDRAPWEMSPRVRQMTCRQNMQAVFARYLFDLGISEFDFKRQSVEIYG